MQKWADYRSILQEKGQQAKDQVKTVKLIGNMIWKSGPFLILALFLFMFFEGILPAFQLYASKQIIDGLSAVDGGASGQQSLHWAWMYAGSMVAFVILSSLKKWVVKILSERSMLSINLLLLRAWENVPGMKFFDQKKYRNRLEALREATGWLPAQIMTISTSFFTGLISLLSIIGLIANLSPLLAILLVASTIPYAIKQNRYAELDWEYEKDAAEERRRMNYARDLLLGRRAAKEVRLFGLGNFFRELYLVTFGKLYARFERLQNRFARDSALTGFFSGAVAGLGYLWIIYQIDAQAITPGDIALYLLAVFQLSKEAREVANDGADTWELWRMADDFRLFIEAEPDIKQAAQPQKSVAGSPMAIEFRDVYFRYEYADDADDEEEAEESEAEPEEYDGDDDSDLADMTYFEEAEEADSEPPETEEAAGREYVLQGVSFSISPGECVAIVGANGSGKTTLVKLLCRFYEQTSGQILIDGQEIGKLNIEDVRKRIAAVFQDLGRYGVTVEENIALASWEMGEQDKLRKTAALAGFDEVASGLPHAYETMLGPEWGGVDLSGGQWQKLAIARALYRDADFIIMDEPTASLDIRAEYELYNSFRELMKGKTVLLISHRFSTVKMANRILVLKNGRIVEEGTHSQLMELGGEYANMYRLQAESFEEDEGKVANG